MGYSQVVSHVPHIAIKDIWVKKDCLGKRGKWSNPFCYSLRALQPLLFKMDGNVVLEVWYPSKDADLAAGGECPTGYGTKYAMG